MVNKHGLSRAIPEAVKRQVRQACGFGCVVCGAIPYEFDHFRVPFADANRHDPEDIVLLCDRHHRAKTSGFIGNEEIALARKVAPLDRPAQFKLDITKQSFSIHWPRNRIEANRQAIVVDGQTVLELEFHQDELQPVVVNGVFSDLNGVEICRIVSNEFSAISENVGDLAVVGNRFTFQTPSRRKTLDFRVDADGLRIAEIFHVRGNGLVYGNARTFRLANGVGVYEFDDCSFTENEVALEIQTHGSPVDYSQLDIERLPRSLFRQMNASQNFVALSIG